MSQIFSNDLLSIELQLSGPLERHMIANMHANIRCVTSQIGKLKMEARTLPAEMSRRRLTEVSSVQPLTCRRGDCCASLLMWMFHAQRYALIAVVPARSACLRWPF